MVASLRQPSSRPELVVDQAAGRVVDAAIPPNRIGVAGPLGRSRVVFALPTGAVELARDGLLVDPWAVLVADSANVVVGMPGRLIVHRMVWAAKVENTRRL